MTGTMPLFLDLTDPDFDTTSARVHAAREVDWLAQTSYGFAVLRYDEANELLTDRRFRLGERPVAGAERCDRRPVPRLVAAGAAQPRL